MVFAGRLFSSQFVFQLARLPSVASPFFLDFPRAFGPEVSKGGGR